MTSFDGVGVLVEKRRTWQCGCWDGRICLGRALGFGWGCLWTACGLRVSPPGELQGSALHKRALTGHTCLFQSLGLQGSSSAPSRGLGSVADESPFVLGEGDDKMVGSTDLVSRVEPRNTAFSLALLLAGSPEGESALLPKSRKGLAGL